MEKKRDLSLDFMKGLAILLVIVEHAISSKYVDSFRQIVPISAVPIFFAITMYLSFGKLDRCGNVFNTWFSTKRIKSIWQHIFKPYIIVMLFSVLIILLSGHNHQIISGLLGGGYGPGSYYVWVYLQVWICIPFIYFILKRSGKIIGSIVILTICVLLNWFCFATDMSDEVYRMVCFRYLFLSVIANIWLHKENYNKVLLTVLGIASYLYLVGIENKSIYPILFDGGWGIHNYPAYFFTLLLIFGFIELHSHLSKESRILKSIYWCGQNSWYLFLSQMTVLYFFGIGHIDFITNSYIKVLAYVLIIVNVCVIITIVVNRVLLITKRIRFVQ